MVDGPNGRWTLVVVGRRGPTSSRRDERRVAAGSGDDRVCRARPVDTLESDEGRVRRRHFVVGAVGRSTLRGSHPHEVARTDRRDVVTVLDRHDWRSFPVGSLVPRYWGEVDVHSTSDRAIHVRRARSGERVDRLSRCPWSEGRPGGEAARRYYPYLYGVRRRRVGCGPASPTNRRRRGVCAVLVRPGVPVSPYGRRAFVVRPSLGRSVVERHRRRDGGWV